MATSLITFEMCASTHVNMSSEFTVRQRDRQTINSIYGKHVA